MQKVVSITAAQDVGAHADSAALTAVLAHDERHVRRKTIRLSNNEKILIDLTRPTVLNAGDLLTLDDGTAVLVEAASEDLFEVRGRDGIHLTQLAWHIGNRHLPAEIAADHILILRDHVIRGMLEGLGASVADVTDTFSPSRGAYDGQFHSHGHGSHSHDHEPHSHGDEHAHHHHG
ncbi:urease accessory protein UreE [Tateyamaria pelophila]|uniref:urease accessory protein UreE n=1 Tax=Tateyamaria pelophila TaxID=328415 RepID=UPI001CBE0E4A|nr:urease accessory protein UreE [Tateyamaria pelophila]